MITANTILYIYTETPLHVGVGSGLSSIDLPIQRERTTQYPMIQGSGIKGKLRAIAEDRAKNHEENKEFAQDVNILFGTSISSKKNADTTTSAEGNEHAGALIAGDARILLFPVRSVNGVFAYTTSYDVLSRFKRDIERGDKKPDISWDIPSADNKVLVTTTSDIQANNTIVLEEFSFDVQASQVVDAIADWIANNALPDLGAGDYWRNKIRNSLVILPNDDFRDFALYATEVITRVRIKRETKTVENGALWTEEHLPSDTLLYVPMYATNARITGPTITGDEVLQKAKSLGINYLQLGGDETVGRGFVRTRWGR